METDESKRGIRKFLLKRMLFVPLGIVALAATSYARQHPDWAEHVYAQGVYPALSSVVGFLPSLVSFSVAVSYTHLDVYKRQVVSLAHASPTSWPNVTQRPWLTPGQCTG